MPQRSARSAPDSSGDVWLQIRGHTRKYFISRTDGRVEAQIDDEAQLEITAMITAISLHHKKHLGWPMHISLLSAQIYTARERTTSAFFGSLTLRASQRSALAYLPPKPFWELPAMISEGSRIAAGHSDPDALLLRSTAALTCRCL
jgi:hypothetical protein